MNCPKCNGTGEEVITPSLTVFCWFCKGHGEVNWIENIFGSESKNIIYSTEREIRRFKRIIKDELPEM
jgi:DnaJ-class molecular chaperone